MSKVDINIKFTSHELQITDNVKKLIAEGVKYGINVEIPKIKKDICTIHINGGYAAFANAIRRFAIEELKTNCLTVTEVDINTNGDSFKKDQFIKNIQSLHLNQYIPKDTIFTLSIENKTDEIMPVLASDLINKSALNCIHNANMTVLELLKPGQFLKLKNVHIISGYGYEDYNKFNIVNRTKYQILSHKPYDDQLDHGAGNLRSIEYNPTEFLIEFETLENVKSIDIIKQIKSEMLSRLNIIKQQISELKDDKYFENEFLEVKQEKMVVITFKTEYVLLPTMIAYRVLNLDKNIQYCNATLVDYNKRHTLFKISHPEWQKIIIDAIDLCIKDVNSIIISNDKLIAKPSISKSIKKK